MATIPRYDSTLGIQPGSLIDNESVFDSAGKLFGNIQSKESQAFEQSQIHTAEQKGAVAGDQPNFKPDSGGGAATEAFNQAALTANKYVLGADVIKNSNSIYNQVSQKIDNNTIPNFNASFQGFSDGVLKNAPEENVPYLKNILAQQYNNGLNKLQKQMNVQNQSMQQYMIDQTTQTYANEATNSAREGNKNGSVSYLAQHQQMIHDAVQNGLMTPGQGALALQQARQQTQEQGIIHDYETALQEGKGDEFIQRFQKSTQYDKILSPSQKDVLVNNLLKLRSQQLAESGITKQKIAQMKNDAITQASNGVTPDSSNLNLIRESDPDNYGLFQQKLNDASWQHSVTSVYRYAPLSQMDTAITQLKRTPPEEELKQSGISGELQTRQKASDQIQKYKQEFLKDPAGFTKNDPAYLSYQKEYSQYGMGSPVEALIDIQKLRGIPQSKIRVMSNDYAAQVTQSIIQLPAAQQIAALNEVQKEYQQYTPIAMRDLARAGLPISSQILIGMDSNPQSLQRIPDAINALETPDKELSSNISGISDVKKIPQYVNSALNPYFNTINGYNGNIQSGRANITSQVTKFAKYLVSQKGMDPQAASKEAANTMINNNYDYQSYNGQHFRIPVQYQNNSENINNAALGYFETHINASNDLRIPPYFRMQFSNLPEAMVKQRYKDSLVTNGYYVTNTDDNGLIFVDANGVPVKTQDGQEFSFDFSNNDFISRYATAGEHFKQQRLTPLDPLSRKLPTENDLGLSGSDVVSNIISQKGLS